MTIPFDNKCIKKCNSLIVLTTCTNKERVLMSFTSDDLAVLLVL